MPYLDIILVMLNTSVVLPQEAMVISVISEP